MIELIGIADVEKKCSKNFRTFKFLKKRLDRKVERAEKNVVKSSTLANLDKYTTQYQKMLSLRDQLSDAMENYDKSVTFLKLIDRFKRMILDFENLNIYNDLRKDLIYKVTLGDDYSDITLQLVDDNYQSKPAGFHVYGLLPDAHGKETFIVKCYNNNTSVELTGLLFVNDRRYYEMDDFVKKLQLLTDEYRKKSQLKKSGGNKNDTAKDTVDPVSNSEADSGDIHQ